MPPARKTCPECGDELYAMHLPRHLRGEHGIDVPRNVSQSGGENRGDPPVPGQGTERQVYAGGESGVNPNASQYDAKEVAPSVEETAPRKPKLFDRLRSRRGRGHDGGRQAPVSGEKPPKRPQKSRGRRVPLDVDISDIWAFSGRRLERTPHYATGRMLQYQAPAAGVILDRAMAGTLPDRLFFQPIARNRDKYEDVGFLLGGPLLTFTITTTGNQMEALLATRATWTEENMATYQDLAAKMEMFKELFAWTLGMMLPRLAEGVKIAREKKAKSDAVISEAFPELGNDDPVQTLFASLFTPPTFEGGPNQNGHADQAAAPPDAEGAVPFGG